MLNSRIKRSLSVFFALSLGISPALKAGNFGRWLHNNTTFMRKLAGGCFSREKYTKETPFKLPKQMPSAATLGQTLQSSNTNFLVGASTSEHQCSHKCTPEICSWSRFAKKTGLAQPSDPEYAINLWDNYATYFQQAKSFGLNSLRFSIEWALVQPSGPDSFDQSALNHYADMFVTALKMGITPIVCFHHYTDPCWFIDRGGFEKEKNLDYFAAFCTQVYIACMNKVQNDPAAQRALQSMHAPLWATFNSPTGYAFKGYQQLGGPPAAKSRSGLKITMTALKNMMESHVRVYQSMKETYNTTYNDGVIQTPQIGLLKNIHQLHPARTTLTQNCMRPLSSICCTVGDMLQNEPFFDFFTNGHFNVQLPFKMNIKHYNQHAPQSLDWIGINYYSNAYMQGPKKLTVTDASATDNDNYRVYPQGLYRAIAQIADRIATPCNIPMYVTENGIATQDDNRRNTFYEKYMYARPSVAEENKLEH